jgi:hypothetical protein
MSLRIRRRCPSGGADVHPFGAPRYMQMLMSIGCLSGINDVLLGVVMSAGVTNARGLDDAEYDNYELTPSSNVFCEHLVIPSGHDRSGSAIKYHKPMSARTLST